jgi:hypothetical protein
MNLTSLLASIAMASVSIGSAKEAATLLSQAYSGKFIMIPAFANTELAPWSENLFADCIAATEISEPRGYDINVCRYSIKDSAIAQQAIERYSGRMERERTVLEEGFGHSFGGKAGDGRWELLSKKSDNTGFYFVRYKISSGQNIFVVLYQINAGLPVGKRSEIADWLKKWEFNP